MICQAKAPAGGVCLSRISVQGSAGRGLCIPMLQLKKHCNYYILVEDGKRVEKCGENMGEKRNFAVECNKKLFVQGCVLTVLGIILPSVIMERRLGIYETLRIAMLTESSAGLIIAATKLVIMNVIRAIPHYLGAFLLNESLKIYMFGKRMFTFNVGISVSLIILVYDIIFYIYGIRYDFGIPAMMIVAFVLLLSYMDLFSVSMINKVLILASLLMSVQWLDIIPSLSEYGFGRGEISMDVKVGALINGESRLLALFAACMFLAFLYASLIQVQLLYKEHKLKISNEKNRKVEQELYDTQIEALKMRNHSEVQSLVHDLKSPLTTIQGLVSLSEIMETDELKQEYYKKISASLTSMSKMISEILYENKKFSFTTGELMKSVLAQVSIMVPNEMLEYHNECEEAKILGNRIRLSRAVINIITNAWNAVDKETGKIEIHVMKQEGNIYIIIRDNGRGISQKNMKHIWELGFSENHSTGLGLAFTRQVVENHKGIIKIESEKGKYTKVIICLREEV